MRVIIQSINKGCKAVQEACKKPCIQFGRIWTHPGISSSSKKVALVANEAIINYPKALKTTQKALKTEQNAVIGFHGCSNAKDLIRQANKCPNHTVLLKNSLSGDDKAGLYIGGDPEFTVYYTGADTVAIFGAAEDHVHVDTDRGTLYVEAGKRAVLLGVLDVKNIKDIKNFQRPSTAQKIAILIDNFKQ